jgi:gas vesicle protein
MGTIRNLHKSNKKGEWKMKRRNVVIGAAVTAGVVTTIGELIYSLRESKQQREMVQPDQNEMAKANEEKTVAKEEAASVNQKVTNSNKEAVKKAREEITNAVKKAREEVMSAVKKAREEVRFSEKKSHEEVMNAGKEVAAVQEEKPKKKVWLMQWLNSESKIISNIEFPQKESQKQSQPEEKQS